MKIVVHWSGGKECYLAYQKAIAAGHEVIYFLSYVYKEPYIYHSFPVMELQSTTLGIPQLKVKIKTDEEVVSALKRLKTEKGIEGIVTGDISNAGCVEIHTAYYDNICKQVGLSLIMPIENLSKDTYQVLKEEISEGIKPIVSCINLAYFGEEWLGRILDEASITELKALTDKAKIDVAGEDGKGYHTMVIDAPLFKNKIEISKFKKKKLKEKSKSGKTTWLLMDVKKTRLTPK